ncbi:zinc finger ccch domain-containing protein 64-like [Plasmopara halstedii]|uniref:Zinc finger ccch domain-containing protein 64-like n=1 Tax=Plasmopara halstedii TaxID=4781 RepID=A0A0N7L741_PLAHL|nr:zinc finger ccch domain-containing protein 64-like [Plasmopara halstedii]CEG46019.1 zinc finger ccch domain-containing protein 64-like [Plasmopara halstedii]|eukprot:XP_024582388.1 zinc finger ccch domain-containing protein 64-like [Plasmopara halstedii]
MPKVLLCGAVQGQWELLFDRVRKLNAAAKENPFVALMCIGRCFPLPEEYLAIGGKKPPVPTYFLPAHESTRSWQESASQKQIFDRLNVSNQLSEPVEVGESFFCLARAGIATIAGLKVAYISGSESLGQEDENGTVLMYSKTSVDTLMQELVANANHGNVDFLLTAAYPANFQLLLPEAQLPASLQNLQGSLAIRDFVIQVHPKYHIVSDGDVFYQRLPYVSTVSGTARKQLTRLIGLSSVNTVKDKTRKYLHALQVVPCMQLSATERQHVDIPTGTTQNPYLYAKDDTINWTVRDAKRRKVATGNLSVEQIQQLTANSVNSAQFFYDQRLAAKGQRKGGLLPDESTGQQRTKPRSLVEDRTECWFCLSTPTLERHLIVSIGQEAYLAMPKGAICEDHVLIVPIAHEASTLNLSDKTWREMDRFKEALRRYFASQEKEILVLDRNVATLGATHCHWQVVGIPKDKTGAARRIFESEGEKYNVKFRELLANSTSDSIEGTAGLLESLRQQTDNKPFLYAEVPDGENRCTRLLHHVEGKHYVQFGRHAVACLLEMPRRANWKFCVISKSEEEKLTQSFKNQWKPFDFTLEEDELSEREE